MHDLNKRKDHHEDWGKNYIQQLQLKNEEALFYVIDTYGGLLMAVIKKHLAAVPDRQEECMNDVLLKIWDHSSCFDEKKSSFKNWAAAVAKYCAIDYLRQYQRELQQLDLEKISIAKEDAELLGVIEKEISEETEQLLACLKPEDQKLFWKLYVEEKSMEEVSRETGMKKDVIYNRVSRGKKKIRKHFSVERGA